MQNTESTSLPWWLTSLPDHILDFPEEILILIFQFAASSPVELVKLSHVCSLFNFLSQQQPFCWQFCPVDFKNLQVSNYNELGNSDRGTASLLLLKHFDTKSPLRSNNPKYSAISRSFEVEFQRQEEQRRMKDLERLERLATLKLREQQKKKKKKKEKTPATLAKDYQLPAIRKPLLVSKDQYVDQLRYLHANEKKYKRLQQGRKQLEDLKQYFEKYCIVTNMALVYALILFIHCGICGVHVTSYLPFDVDPNVIFYPFKLLVVNAFIMLAVLLFNDQFQKRSDSATIPLILSCIGVFFIYQYMNIVQHCVVSGILANDSTAGITKRINSWFFIVAPFILIAGFSGGLFYFEDIHKDKIHSYYPFVLKKPLKKEGIMTMSLAISFILQMCTIACHLEGYTRYSLFVVFLFAYIQEIMWCAYFIKELRDINNDRDRKNIILLITAMGALMWLHTSLALGIRGGVVFTPLMLVATFTLWSIIEENN
jgi:hypothetical protein